MNGDFSGLDDLNCFSKYEILFKNYRKIVCFRNFFEINFESKVAMIWKFECWKCSMID